MGFNSGNALSRLDYDLTAHMPGVAGEVPEPSQGARRELADTIADVLDEARGTDTSEAVQKIDRMSRDEQRVVLEKLRAAIVKLCAGSPSAETLDAMPARVYDSFTGWLMGELFPQTASRSDTTG